MAVLIDATARINCRGFTGSPGAFPGGQAIAPCTRGGDDAETMAAVKD
ncbi:hypothetical protein ACVDG3_06175 [Meridianimarinicoccus sp. RP-17]|nr:hypothetical protein [Phycocomes zhengii]